MRIVESGERIPCGPFTLTFIESAHSRPDRYPGAITDPLDQPVRRRAYKSGEICSIVVQHTSGRTALIQGSAGFGERPLADLHAVAAYLGVGQLGLLDETYMSTSGNARFGLLARGASC